MAGPNSTSATAPAERDDVYNTVYSPSFLSTYYDYQVLGFNMRYMWGCPTDTVLLPFFSEHFSRRHLDIGVATGYFPAAALARPFRKDSEQFLTLIDINANSLAAAKARVLSTTTRTEVNCIEADVTKPLPKALQGMDRRYDTISMFNLFHCVPGSDKLKAFGIYKELLADDGVLAGCTVLGPKHATGWVNSWFVRRYNRLGYFNNLQDEQQDFEDVLHREFEEVETWLLGMTLLFRARKPRGRTEASLI